MTSDSPSQNSLQKLPVIFQRLASAASWRPEQVAEGDDPSSNIPNNAPQFAKAENHRDARSSEGRRPARSSCKDQDRNFRAEKLGEQPLHSALVTLGRIAMARPVGTAIVFPSWTWAAVLTGVFASLRSDPTYDARLRRRPVICRLPDIKRAPRATAHFAFAWWAVSGIIAAFIGGAVAAANAPDQSDAGRFVSECRTKRNS